MQKGSRTLRSSSTSIAFVKTRAAQVALLVAPAPGVGEVLAHAGRVAIVAQDRRSQLVTVSIGTDSAG